MKLSLIIPCYNEQENVRAFYDAAKAAFRSATFVRPDASHRVMITVDATDASVVVHACLRGFVLHLR